MSKSGARAPWRDYDRAYRAFQDREGIPVHTGMAVEDIRTLEVGDWERTGARGAFINLFGMEGMCDLQIHEVPPGGALTPQRHLHDELVFVVSGSGFTSLGDGEEETSFEWDENAFFYLPRNTPYRHANASDDEPVRLLAQTTLPFLYSLLPHDDPIWHNDAYDQWAEMGDDPRYSSVKRLSAGDDGRWYWESNFVPDATSLELKDQSDRGAGNTNARFPFRDGAHWGHISEFPPGRYKKAHRHICGANVLLLSGEGYSLLWQAGDEERIRVDWGPYSLFDPPTMWYHQQFNTSRDPARYLVFHSPLKGTGLMATENDAMNPRSPTNQIEYHEEDPAIREAFVAELEEKGIEFEMDPDLYEPPA